MDVPKIRKGNQGKIPANVLGKKKGETLRENHVSRYILLPGICPQVAGIRKKLKLMEAGPCRDYHYRGWKN